jgi:hypothetical protein
MIKVVFEIMFLKNDLKYKHSAHYCNIAIPVGVVSIEDITVRTRIRTIGILHQLVRMYIIHTRTYHGTYHGTIGTYLCTYVRTRVYVHVYHGTMVPYYGR